MKDFLIPYIGPICSECLHPCYKICLGCNLFVHPNCKTCSCKSNDIISKQKKLKEKRKGKRVKFSTLKSINELNNNSQNIDYVIKDIDLKNNIKEDNKLCKNIIESTTLIKSIDTSSLETEILLETRNGEICTICSVEYSELDIEMIFCEGCEIWIHRECAGLTEKEYINLEKEDEDFFCFKCLFNYCDFCGLNEYKGDSNLYFTNSSPTFTSHNQCIPKGYSIDEIPFNDLNNKKNTINLFAYKKLIKIFKEPKNKIILCLKTINFENSIFQKEKKTTSINKIWKDIKIIEIFLKREKYLIKNVINYLKNENINKELKENINYLKNDNPLNSNWENLVRKKLNISEIEFKNKLNKIHALLFNEKEEFNFNLFKQNQYFEVYYRSFEYLFIPFNIISFHKFSIDFINNKCELDEHEIPALIIPKQYINDLNANKFPNMYNSIGEKVEIKFSKIEGFGVFAKSTFFKDELIDFYGGIEIKNIESDLLEKYYISNNLMDQIYMFSFDSGLRIKDGTFIGNYAKFYNNSCEPNCYANEVLIGNKVELGIYAKRVILKGEELTYKYDLSGEEKITCLCKSDVCIGYL